MRYSIFFLTGLLLILICSWYSIGYYHWDEQAQILEFANFKLGKTNPSHLTWEYGHGARAALLPYIIFWFIRALNLFGIYNPFTITVFIRVVTGTLAWFTNYKMCMHILSTYQTELGKKLLVLLCTILWFVPFLSVRFTPENISGICLIWGIYILLKRGTSANINNMMVGILFGICIFIRLQMLFALIGVIAWLLFYKKIKLFNFTILCLFVLVSMALNVVADSLFYGHLLFTPYNYFDVNILQHAADGYGISPWWRYIFEFIIKAVPPISLGLLLLFFIGLWKNKNSVFVWAIVPFLIAHFAISHKELRFLFPVLLLFVYICSSELDRVINKSGLPRWLKTSLIFCFVFNAPILLYRTLSPAEINVSYNRFLYNEIRTKGTPLVLLNKGLPIGQFADSTSFYESPNITPIVVEDSTQLNSYLAKTKAGLVYYIGNKLTDDSLTVNGYRKSIVYCYYPDWILKYNINNWEERTGILCVYKLIRNISPVNSNL